MYERAKAIFHNKEKKLLLLASAHIWSALKLRRAAGGELPGSASKAWSKGLADACDVLRLPVGS
jgi:hypothetical protein